MAGQEWKCTECQFKWRKSEVVKFDGDLSQIPPEYVRIKEELDKTKVKKALKDGIEISGATIEVKNNLQIKE